MGKQRILYITDSLMAGGIESQLIELVTRLDRERFEPYLLCLYGPPARSLHFAPQVRAAHIPLMTLDLGWGITDKIRAVASIIATVRRVRPQIVQTEGYHANLLTRLAAPCLPPLKLIGSLRGVPTRKQLLYERLSQGVCRRIVVNAPHLQEMLVVGARIPASKVFTIPNGITVEHYAQPHDGRWREQIAPFAHRVFVSLGRISFEKNMHWLVRGLALLKQQEKLPPDIRLFIVGPVQDLEAKRLLDETIRQHGLEAIVQHHAETVHPEDYYHACDVSVLYSPAEGLPNVCLESLAAGRPVLISQMANAAGVIEDGVTGWVVRLHDPEHLAETFSRIITLPESELAKMREACVQRAHDYRADALVERYMRLYAQV
jgi:glycosyltransferase involved in cell wall biosynthesis